MSESENSRASTSKGANVGPPPLSIKLPKKSDLPSKSEHWRDGHLPVDILLLTVDDCEFLACYHYLRNSFRSYHDSLGCVYFGNMGDEKEPWKVALIVRSPGPGGSQTDVRNAVTILRPKATFCVGFCSGLNHEKTKLGDVVVSSKLTTDAYKTPVSRGIANFVRHAADGWKAPLESPEVPEVNVHCDGVILSCPDLASAERQHNLHPEAIAVELEGKGIFAAAHDMKVEWVIVKGVSDFAKRDCSTHESWKTFACFMAASVVSNMLSDPVVFKDWPHYREEDNSQDAKGRKRTTSDLAEEDKSQDAKRMKLMTSGHAGTVPIKFKGVEDQRLPWVELTKHFNETHAAQIQDKDYPRTLYYYLKAILDLKLIEARSGSLWITVECSTVEILERLWEDYCSGHLNAVAEERLLTDDIKRRFDVESIKLETTILEEDYLACKLFLTGISQGDNSTITSMKDFSFSSSQDSLQMKLMTLDLAEEDSSTNTSKTDLPFSSFQDAKGRKRDTKRTKLMTSDLAEEDSSTGITSKRDLPFSSSQGAKRRKRDAKGSKRKRAETFNLKECQKQLKDFYNTRDKVKVVPLSQNKIVHFKDIYTNLSWVRDDRTPSGVTEKKLEDYTDIFDGDEHHPNPNRILVSGGPGIGKTIFSKKIALDWSQRQMKEILSKFDIVLRIALRDVCDLHDIHDVLKASKLLAGDGEISIDSLYDYIHQNQEKVLLILDGYDEYSCAGEQSPIRDIWEGTLLRNCHVILTTRQGQVDEVKGHGQVQFKINGFNSEDQVKAFASKFLKGEEDVQEFVKYLKQKHLMGIAEIPLLLLMLCSIWQEKHTGLPTASHADIYTHFILTLLDHKIEKDADSKQLKDVNDYNEELCKLGKLAFDELLRDSLVIRCSELPDKNLVQKLGEVGLCQILNLSGLNRGKGVYFIHKSIQEFLAAWYLKEELLSRKDENTTCLSKVDSFEKTVKMIEVFKFAYELSGEAAFKIVNFLGMIGEKEGLTEYIFAETPSVKDLSNDQTQFLTLISHSFFHCTPEKRQDLYTVFLSYVGGVLLIDSDQLHSIADEHLLKSAEAPKFIFFSSGKHSEQGYRPFISVLEDVNAVVVCCSGEMKAADLLKKHPFRPVNEFFLKKEKQMKLYVAKIEKDCSGPKPFPIEMLKELISSPKSTQTKKKPVDDQSNEQDNRTALCSTENIDITSGSTRHCLSWVSDIDISDIERQEMETLIEVLPFVTSPRRIIIIGKYGEFTHDAQLIETLVSRINFTNRLDALDLIDINLTAEPTAVMTRSMTQAPNLRALYLALNPLGEGVSDLTRHLSCVPHLETLYLHDVKMTKKQVNDLTAAVRQSNISSFSSFYHDREGNPKPEHKWPIEVGGMLILPWRSESDTGSSTEHEWPTDEFWNSSSSESSSEDESDAGSSAVSVTEKEDE